MAHTSTSFDMQGKNVDFSTRQGYTPKSQQTNTSDHLSQQTLYSPDNRRPAHHPPRGPIPLDFTGSALHKNRPPEDASNREPTDTTCPYLNEHVLRMWLVDPVHVDRDTEVETETLRDSQELEQNWKQTMVNRTEILTLAQEYFPVTFSASWVTRKIDFDLPEEYPLSSTAISDSLPLVYPDSSSEQNKKIRPKSPVNGTVKDRNFTYKQDPIIADSRGPMCTPYQFDLARLRRDLLRLEEDYLLEHKRQEEIERVRGPIPYWYELRTPQFSHELQKNNFQLKHDQCLDSLLTYRRRLEEASREFADRQMSNTI